MTTLYWLLLPLGCKQATPTDEPLRANAVDRAAYEADLRTLAVPRSSGTPGWQAAQDLCAERFEQYGYTVTREAFDTGTNVIGRKSGTGGSTVVISAHYDSVENCAGADDNASGVAGVLEVARVLQDVQLEDDVVFACWDEEEAGLRGSLAWVQQTTDDIAFAWSFEMLGYASSEPNSQTLPFGLDVVFPAEVAAIEANDNRGDFITFVADTPMESVAADFERHAQALGLPVISLLLSRDLVESPLTGDLKRSDHAPFWAAGIPAVMLTDSANFRNPAYHCQNGRDTVDRLDLDFATDVVQAVIDTLVE